MWDRKPLRTVLDAGSIRRAVGIDYSDVYVAAARERFNDPRVTIDTGDACALPYPDANFDYALSLLVLHFVPDAQQAIREMRRVTRHHGLVAAAVWDSYGGMPNQRMFWDTAVAINPEGEPARIGGYWRPMVRPGELGRAFRDAGLANVQEAESHIRMEYTDFDDFWWPVAAGEAALGKYFSSLNSAEQDKLATAVRAAYVAGQPDGARSFTATAWACAGRVE